MALIKKLTEDIAGKIAAGEIIERPENIVKELVENSIDAGASAISIEVGNGGKSLIAVKDDGAGIPAEEITAATENYSTSKISRIEDIENISTLGFRGEALASIKSVSKLTVLSRSDGDDTAREVSFSGQEIIGDRPAARERGTTITVRDLFFNLPARKKFLSSDSAELRRINALVQKFAMAFPDVAFRLGGGGKEYIDFSSGSFDERVEDVLGNGIFTNMRYIDNRREQMRICGFVSKPDISRGNRTLQYIFINKRFVKDRVITNALRRAYDSIIPSGRFPIAVIFIEIPPDRIDVNVHPTKSQVRFSNEKEVHNFVYSSIREGSRAAETISFKDKVESVYRSIFPESGEKGSRFSKRGEDASQISMLDNNLYQNLSRSEKDHTLRESPESLLSEEEQLDNRPMASSLYWQLHNSYILIQIRSGMVVIDQHAAHERILYNRARNNMTGEKPAIQSLLFPATLELSPLEHEQYEKISEILPSIGFEVESFGMRSIIVRGIPAGVKNWNDGALLKDILSERGRGGEELDEVLKRFACHSAIRAGEKMSSSEMESLVDQLFATDYPFTCPHGRPTILRVSLSELNRRFHRPSTTEK